MATAISTLRFYEWSGSDCLPWPPSSCLFQAGVLQPDLEEDGGILRGGEKGNLSQ